MSAKKGFTTFMKTERGFTLLELLVVIAILAVLSVIGFVIFGNIKGSASDAKRKSDIEAIAKAYETQFDPVNSTYQPLTANNFTNGIPSPPEGGSYQGLITAASSGFRVCSALEGYAGICTQNSPTCFCLQSSQGDYVAPPTPTPTPAPTATPGPTPTPGPTCPSTGLASYYKMDEASGTTLNDYFGINNGTAQFGATPGAPGKPGLGTAWNFDGSGYIDSTTALANSSFTISGWINETDLATDRVWLGVGYGGTNATLHLKMYADRSLILAFWSNDLRSPTGLFSPGWHHTAYTYDLATNQRKIYLDGNQVASDISTSPFIGTNTLKIGSRGDGNERWLGLIDEVGIWNRALTGPASNCTIDPNNEVCNLHNSGAGRTCP